MSTVNIDSTMSPAQENTTTAIFDITHQCLDAFNQVEAQYMYDQPLLTHRFSPNDAASSPGHRKRSSCDFLGLRNSFLIWVNYTGALSLMDSSLDARLVGLTDISAMVVELLEMVLRNLHRVRRAAGDGWIPSCSGATAADPKRRQTVLSNWENASRAVGSALDRLHFVAKAIKKASAKKLDDTVTAVLTEEDVVFRRHVAILVRSRFPAARESLCQQVADSVAFRRRKLLRSERHAKRIAVRRPVPEPPAAKQPEQPCQEVARAIDHRVHDRLAPQPITVASGMTKASRPNPQASVIRNLHRPRRPALTTVITAVSTAHEDAIEYPPPPKACEGEAVAKCPFCFEALERKASDHRNTDQWKHHLDEHLSPYACLFPDCAASLAFFTRRHEWRAHMETAHPKDWMRKVHTLTWYCDMDHDVPVTFETEERWRVHMKDLESHPRRKLTVPTEAQLRALSVRKQQVALRANLVCPLCERIPDKIQPLAEKGTGDQINLDNFMLDHVANHLKSLSLLAVPSLGDSADGVIDASGQSKALTNGSFPRSMDGNSAPRPPSGQDQIDGASLPPMVWSFLDQGSIMSLISCGPSPAWDQEYLDYAHPKEPPAQLQQEWIDRWETWKSEHDSNLQHRFETDPVLVRLRNAKGVEPMNLVESPVSNGVNIDTQDDAGRTGLSFAAEIGSVDVVQSYLEKGAQVEKADHDGQTPLLWAAKYGHESVVQLLLDRGARVDASDQIYGRTPLSWAASSGHLAVVKVLLERGAAVNAGDNSRRTPLSWASSRGHEDIVRLLINHSASIELPDRTYGRTPLLWAVKSGHAGVARLLLESGVDVNASDLHHGRTALSWAAEIGESDILQMLVSRGADVEAVDGDSRQTPLALAAENGHEDVVKILLEEHGANLAAKDRQGWTPLRWAAENKHGNVARLLRAHGSKTPPS